MDTILIKSVTLLLTPFLLLIAAGALLSVKNRKENIFTVCFLLLSIHTICYPLYYMDIFLVYPYLYGYNISIPYILIPLLYIMIRQMVHEEFQIRFFHLAHLIPALIRYITLIPFYFLGREEKLSFIQTNLGKTFPDDIPGTDNYPAVVVYLIFYLMLTGWRFIQKTKFTLVKYITLNSQNYSVYLFNLFWIIPLLVMSFYLIIYHFSEGIFWITLSAIPVLMLSLPVFYFFWQGYKIGKFSARLPEYAIKSNKQNVLDDAALQSINESITRIITEKKIYLREKITLKNFADELGISAHELSCFLNYTREERFQDFINFYRVYHAIGLMRKDELDFNFSRIAYESGFGSKSSFQCAFKKHTGLTPSDWKKTLLCSGRPVLSGKARPVCSITGELDVL